MCVVRADSLEISEEVKRSHLAVLWPPDPAAFRLSTQLKADKMPGSCLGTFTNAGRTYLGIFSVPRRCKMEIMVREREAESFENKY